jgi:hypothetical protein
MYCRYLLLLLVSVSAVAEKPSAQTINVVELFTSQGCYSCPPADEFLGELDKRPDYITFSCHVTYWNYLGWKDTFSRSFCDNRQRQYQSVLRGYKGVYTPQMVINGRYAGVGSKRSRIEGLIEQDHRRQASIQPIVLQVNSENLVVKLPKIVESDANKRQLFLLGTSGAHVLPINNGENSGKRLPYFNPVEYVQNMGQWDGQAKTVEWMLPRDSTIKDWVVVAQVWPIGEITAAGKAAASISDR